MGLHGIGVNSSLDAASSCISLDVMGVTGLQELRVVVDLRPTHLA